MVGTQVSTKNLKKNNSVFRPKRGAKFKKLRFFFKNDGFPAPILYTQLLDYCAI